MDPANTPILFITLLGRSSMQAIATVSMEWPTAHELETPTKVPEGDWVKNPKQQQPIEAASRTLLLAFHRHCLFVDRSCVLLRVDIAIRSIRSLNLNLFASLVGFPYSELTHAVHQLYIAYVLMSALAVIRVFMLLRSYPYQCVVSITFCLSLLRERTFHCPVPLLAVCTYYMRHGLHRTVLQKTGHKPNKCNARSRQMGVHTGQATHSMTMEIQAGLDLSALLTCLREQARKSSQDLSGELANVCCSQRATLSFNVSNRIFMHQGLITAVLSKVQRGAMETTQAFEKTACNADALRSCCARSAPNAKNAPKAETWRQYGTRSAPNCTFLRLFDCCIFQLLRDYLV